MKKLKALSTVLLSGLFLFSFAACGGTAGGNNEGGGGDNQQGEENNNGQNQGHTEKDSYTFDAISSEEHKLDLAVGASKTVELNADITKLRYFRMEVETDIDVLGTFTYTASDKSGELTENFYIAAGETEFRQFLDAFRTPSALTNSYIHENKTQIGQAKKANKLISLSFSNVSKKAGTFSLKKLEGSTRTVKVANPVITIQNDSYKVGADLTYGGALTYLARKSYDGKNVDYVTKDDGKGNTIGYVGVEASKEAGAKLRASTVNLINVWDAGRLVQQSYYGSNEGYEEKGITFNGSTWCYNPVQGGDCGQNRGQIVDYRLYNDEIYVKTRAMDWAQNGYTTPSYMENRYSLDGENVIVYNSFVDWSGKDAANARQQEMPAIYLHYSFTQFYSYRGIKPWKYEQITPKALGWWGTRPTETGNELFGDANESWVAWTNDKQFGVGIYVPGIKEFLNGVSRGNAPLGENNRYVEGLRPSVHGETTDDDSTYGAVCYSAPLVARQMKSYHKTDYTYVMSVGYVNEIRYNFYELHEQNKIVNDNMF